MAVNKKLMIPLVSLMVALIGAGITVTLVLRAESAYSKKRQDVEIATGVNIDDTLFAAEKAVEQGDDISYYFKTLGRLDTGKMSADQTLRYTMLWGDMYLIRYRTAGTPRARQLFFDRAVKEYNLAAQMTSSMELKSSLNRRVGQLMMENQNWTGALDSFKKAYPLLTLPREKWMTDLNMAQCYIKLDRMDMAFQKYGAATGSDNMEIQGEALIAQARLMLDAATNPKLKLQLEKYLLDKEPALSVAMEQDKVDEYFKKQALKLFEEVNGKVGKVSPVFADSQLGLIEIAVVDKDSAKAYNIANQLLNGPAGNDAKVKTLLLLARLEEEREDYHEAIDLIKRALDKYPVAAARLKAGSQLYNLYTKIRNWDAAFSVARNLFQRSSDPDAICKLINDFSTGKSLIFDIIIQSRDRNFYVNQLNNVYTDMSINHPEDWAGIRVNAYYILAQLYYASGDFAKAQDALNSCYFYTKDQEQITESILRLDLLCALSSKASPALVIARARRYLNRYPRGEYYREALLELLRRYYDMELYGPALDISRKIYADELDTAGKNINRNSLWIETVSIIAGCYHKLGEDQKANRLLRNFSDEIVSREYGPNVYFAWAMMAQSEKQDAEALRRLSVALMYTRDPRTLLKIKVAQCLLRMKAGSLKDFYEAADFLKQVNTVEWLTDAQKMDYERRLLESMLAYSLNNSMYADFDAVLNATIRKDYMRPWAQYWVLRALTPAFEQEDLKELSTAHERILKSDYSVLINDKDSFEFIREQLGIIKELIRLEDKANYLNETKGVKL